MNEATLTAPIAPVKITLAISFAVIAQSALALIWAGSAAERITQLERRINETNQLIERTARLEEQVLTMRTTLDRIETKIDAIDQKR